MKPPDLIRASATRGYGQGGWSRLEARLFAQPRLLPLPCSALTPSTAEPAERSPAAAGCEWAGDLLLALSPAVHLKNVVICGVRMTEAVQLIPEIQVPCSFFFSIGFQENMLTFSLVTTSIYQYKCYKHTVSKHTHMMLPSPSASGILPAHLHNCEGT